MASFYALQFELLHVWIWTTVISKDFKKRPLLPLVLLQFTLTLQSGPKGHSRMISALPLTVGTCLTYLPNSYLIHLHDKPLTFKRNSVTPNF